MNKIAAVSPGYFVVRLSSICERCSFEIVFSGKLVKHLH